GSFVYSFVRDRCTIPIDFVRTAVRPDSDPVMLKESCAFHKRTLWPRRNDSYSSLCHWIQPRLWQRVAKCEPDHPRIVDIALESKIADLKSQMRIPRGLT